MKKYLSLIITILVLCACSADVAEPVIPPDGTDYVTITFDFEKQSGYASNQFAVWIEDAEGNLVKTLYVTKFTANGGYKNRPDSITLWVEKANPAENEIIAGATPKSGTLDYIWDFTDANGNTVPDGEYTFYVEGSLRWNNSVLYSGVINTDGGEITTEVKFTYEASDNQPALTEDSPENSMIVAVAAKGTRF